LNKNYYESTVFEIAVSKDADNSVLKVRDKIISVVRQDLVKLGYTI